MEYKNQTENRAFQEMLQAAVKRLQNRSGEDLAAKSGAVFHSSRNVLEVLSFYEVIEIQLPEFCINFIDITYLFFNCYITVYMLYIQYMQLYVKSYGKIM